MILNGPSSQYVGFWKVIQKKIEIEDPIFVDRVSGRRHKLSKCASGATIQFDRIKCAENAGKTYEGLSGMI